MSHYFSKLYSSQRDIKVEIDLSNYTRKPDVKKQHVLIHLANLKADVDELDIDKLKTVPTSMVNLKSIVDKIDLAKLKTVAVDLKNLVML